MGAIAGANRSDEANTVPNSTSSITIDEPGKNMLCTCAGN